MSNDDILEQYNEQLSIVKTLKKSVEDIKTAFEEDRDFLKRNVDSLSSHFIWHSPIIDTFINNFDCGRCMADHICDVKNEKAVNSCKAVISSLEDSISNVQTTAD